MLQRLGMELPDWARAKHPHVRYELGQAQRTSTPREICTGHWHFAVDCAAFRWLDISSARISCKMCPGKA